MGKIYGPYSFMKKVNWYDEELEGDNNGLIHGLYFMKSYDKPTLIKDEIYGGYNYQENGYTEVEDAMWFATEKERGDYVIDSIESKIV